MKTVSKYDKMTYVNWKETKHSKKTSIRKGTNNKWNDKKPWNKEYKAK